jgi:REP element-mobilizing transposase RayT
MPNHIHLLIQRTTDENISAIVRDIKKYFSFRFKKCLIGKTDYKLDQFMRNGNYHLWEQRFDEFTIKNEDTFKTKLEYIHKNPVKAGLVKDAGEYKYSSAGFYLKGENPEIPTINYWRQV